MYKYLDKDKFIELVSNNKSVIIQYSEKLNLSCKKPEDLTLIKSFISKDIDSSKVYEKAEKLKLSEYDKEDAKSYIEAFNNYVDSSINYAQYRNNLIEKEAFFEGDLTKKQYDKFKEVLKESVI